MEVIVVALIVLVSVLAGGFAGAWLTFRARVGQSPVPKIGPLIMRAEPTPPPTPPLAPPRDRP